MMRRLCRFVVFILSWNIFLKSHKVASGSSILWSKDLVSTSTGSDMGERCTVDSQGNLYYTGFSNGDNFLGYLPNSGGKDIVTLKIAHNGTILWARYFGTTSDDQSFDIAVDSHDYPIICGYSQGSWDVANQGANDVVIIKFDKNNGTILFSRLFGTLLDDFSYGISIDSSDDSILMAGYTKGSLLPFTNQGQEDNFVVKYSSTGVFQWVLQFGTNGSERANGLVVDPNGNTFLTGTVTSGTFDQAFGGRDSFLAKINRTGSLQWVRQFGSNGSDISYYVDYDSAHNLVACGQVRGPFSNDPWGGSADIACIKYDQSGNVIWKYALGNAGFESAWTVDIVRSFNSHTPGSASKDLIFISGFSDGSLLNFTAQGYDDIAVLMINSDAELQWLTMFGSVGDDQATGIQYDPTSGDLYVAGYFENDIAGILNHTGSQDAFVMLMGPPFSTNDQSPGGNKGSVGAGVIAGAVLGSFLGLMLLLGIVGAVFYIRRRKANNVKMMEMFNSDDQSGGSMYIGVGSQGTHSVTSKSKKDSSWEINYAELILEKKIGQGASGVVYKGKWRKTEIACKQLMIGKASEKDIVNFRAEAELMRNLRPNKNVLLYYGVCTDPLNPLCIVTEFVSNGNLWALLQNSSFKWTNTLKLKIIKGVANGMYHLAKEKIVHRDLAARNILLNDSYEAKISDFGLSRVVENEDDSNQTVTNVGPIRWMSPESIMQRMYSEKSDVWSFAVLVHEILTQSQPYAGTTQLEVAALVGNKQLRLNYPKNVPVISDLLGKCLDYDPDHRPRFEDIVEILEKVSVSDTDQFMAV